MLLAAALAYVGVRAWHAKAELQQAQVLVTTLKDQIVQGGYAQAPQTFDSIEGHTRAARELTNDPLWSTAEHVPMLGRNLSAMRELTAVIDDAMRVSKPLLEIANELDPATLKPEGGRVPLEPVVQAGERVTTANADFAALRARLDKVDTKGTIHQLKDVQTQLEGVIDSATTALGEAEPLLRTLPAILGADGPRTYVVMFQNNAELRSLGGTALSFAEIGIDDGRISLTSVVPAGEGNFPRRWDPIIPVPDGFEELFPHALGRFIANSTLRPSSATAAQIVQAEWQATFGKHIDGVVSIDSGALAFLLKATGPITLSTGDGVSAETVVSLLLNQLYTRYNSGHPAADDLKQGAIYSEALVLTFDRLSSGQFDPEALSSSVLRAATQKRLSFWFSDESEQTLFAQTAVGARDLPESTATEDVAGVYLNDQVGSKLNFYLATTLTTGSAVCTPDGRQVHRLTMAMNNLLAPEAVKGLSPSISGTLYSSLGLAKGVQRLLLFVYLPSGASLLATSQDGIAVASTGQHDTDRAVQSIMVEIPPGASRSVTVDILMDKPGERALVADVTPTVDGTIQNVVPLDCGSVRLP